MALATLFTPAVLKITPSSMGQDVDTSAQQCSICRETLEEPSLDGEIETAYVLPCSHVFGSICITRWLDASPNHNCPTCRRPMRYISCGHPIEPFEASKVSQGVKAEDMPEKCLLCRQGGVWEERLAFLKERQQAEESILAGLSAFLPTAYGAMSGSNSESVRERIEESRRRLKDDVEFTRIVLEKEIGKVW